MKVGNMHAGTLGVSRLTLFVETALSELFHQESSQHLFLGYSSRFVFGGEFSAYSSRIQSNPGSASSDVHYQLVRLGPGGDHAHIKAARQR